MATESERTDVALFPIPNVVAFPGTVLPLHVFEPRYRRLVNDCVRDERPVGVCHTRKTIHEPNRQQTLEEALRSNQATYQPHEIFSAGRCEVRETTPDGRIFAQILMEQRFVLVDEVQSLPYRIVSCEPLEDEPTAPPGEPHPLQRLINDKLAALIGAQNPDLGRQLERPEWLEQDPSTFSFKIFQFLRFEADVMQTVLEARSADARLELIWELLRHA